MITPTKLTWPEINRIINIITYAPCQSKPDDLSLMERTGLFRYCDEDREAIELVEGAEESFFEYAPQARVRTEWRSLRVLPSEIEAIQAEEAGLTIPDNEIVD